jgi:hypothetical protein
MDAVGNVSSVVIFTCLTPSRLGGCLQYLPQVEKLPTTFGVYPGAEKLVERVECL